MILTTVRHGRNRRDTRYLLAHLSRQDGQRSRVVHVAAPVASAPEALEYMSALRDGSRATVSYHHISMSPAASLTDEQRDEAVTRALTALGAEDHAHVVWEHAGKGRRGRDVEMHFHVVVSHVGPDGRALDDGRSYVRLEAAARTLEHDWGHDLISGRRTAAVAAELDRMGRPDVAARVRGEAAPEPPQSAISSRQRARAERHGVFLPDVREIVREAWSRSDSPAALRAALAEHGLSVAAGDKSGVWIVRRDGQTLGALDRLAGQRRREVAARMQEIPYDAAPDPARNARPEGDVRRGARKQRGGGGPGSAACPSRPGPAGGRQSSGRSDGTADIDPADAAADPCRDRGPGTAARRGGNALAILELRRAARSPEVQRQTRRLKRHHHPRGRDILDARRLARVDLDELRRMAEEIGRRLTAFLTRLSRPVPPPTQDNPREALRAHLRQEARRPRRVSPRPNDDMCIPTSMPRF